MHAFIPGLSPPLVRTATLMSFLENLQINKYDLQCFSITEGLFMSPKQDTGLEPDEHGDIVRKGYNIIAGKYYQDRDLFENMKEINDFIEHLPDNAVVLDIGCGGGVPVLKILVEKGYTAKGIDFSTGMLELAKKNVPDAELIQGDIMKTDFEADSLDGIISTYAIIHIHRSYHPALYLKIYNWLKSGGVMLVSTAKTDWEEVHDYFGVEMAWNHPPAHESLQMIVNTGFEILFERLVTTGEETHYWILAKKP
ncbi:MAG: class I SAM-dependent methyltransferase [Candidatus Thorarchaeota archaeon]|nr:MAG: class I SAM-dependent methyltransferase [Candidatus Thorarchaeota archaeon]